MQIHRRFNHVAAKVYATHDPGGIGAALEQRLVEQKVDAKVAVMGPLECAVKIERLRSGMDGLYDYIK